MKAMSAASTRNRRGPWRLLGRGWTAPPCSGPDRLPDRCPGATLEQDDGRRGHHEPDRPSRDDRAAPELNDPDRNCAQSRLNCAEGERDRPGSADPRSKTVRQVVASTGEQRDAGPSARDGNERRIEHWNARQQNCG